MCLCCSCVVTRRHREVPGPQQNTVITQRVYKTAARKTCQSLQAVVTEPLGGRGWEDGMQAAEHIPEALGCWWDPKPLVCLQWEMSWLGACCVWTSHVSWTLNAIEILRFLLVFFFFSSEI